MGRLRVLFIVGALAAALLGARPHLAAQTEAGAIARIDTPSEGQQLFGVETIHGTATVPLAFDSYTLEYYDLSNPNAQWLLVQPRVRQQVRDGVLGAWNTTFVPDGVYRLRLRVFGVDGAAAEYLVGSVRVANAAPTPVPTQATGQGVLPPAATVGPTATSPVQQPPSNNPSAELRPEVEPAAPVLAVQPSAGSPRPSTRVDFGRVRSAFCSGFYLAAAGFGLGAVLVLIRRRWRSSPGRTWTRADEAWPDDF